MKNQLFCVLAILSLTACYANRPLPNQVGAGDGAYYTPVIDGPQDEVYYKDLRECRQLAARVQQQQETATTEDAITGAVAAGLVGALLGSTESSDDALIGGLVGATVGGAVGAAGAIEEAEQSGKTVITRCMRGRGHNVLL